MAINSLLSVLDARSPALLTVRAQAIPALDRDEINLFLRFFPFQDVDSVRLADVTTLDFRPVADRREWNAHGRKIPLKSPAFRDLEMNPVEAEFVYDERMINRLAEQAMGNEQIIRDVMRAQVPQRVDVLTDSVYRRLFLDCMLAWATGTITIRNPQDGSTYAASYGMDSTRYFTAPTAYNDAGINAYDTFMADLETAAAKVGPISGALMRRATQTAILADAPNLQNSVKMTRGQLADRISQDIGFNFEFAIVENTVDVFDDGGTATTRTAVWPTHKIAVIPEGDTVGRTARAPVRRVGQLVPGLTPDQYDIRSVAIFPEERNSGKELAVQAQMNAMPVPDEQRIFVIDAGV